MKILYLTRHAKSSGKHHDLIDFDRPLNKRGKRDAPFMGKVLADRKIQIQLILSSPAARALQTARRLAKPLDYDRERIATDQIIYLGGAVPIIYRLHQIDDGITRLMLVGHNPI